MLSIFGSVQCTQIYRVLLTDHHYTYNIYLYRYPTSGIYLLYRIRTVKLSIRYVYIVYIHVSSFRIRTVPVYPYVRVYIYDIHVSESFGSEYKCLSICMYISYMYIFSELQYCVCLSV